jgi:SAM-dependent methyltransferase
MGFYARMIFPLLCDFGLDRPFVARYRRELLAHASGNILEKRLPFEDGTFDCAVSTFTLCSIEEAAQAVREVYRVLKAGGRFLILEHGLSPEPKV